MPEEARHSSSIVMLPLLNDARKRYVGWMDGYICKYINICIDPLLNIFKRMMYRYADNVCKYHKVITRMRMKMRMKRMQSRSMVRLYFYQVNIPTWQV